MSEKKVIKVIKKGELKQRQRQRPVEKAATARQTARDMVQTVTNWVNELQQKRRDETIKAIKSLNPRPSEA